MQIIKQREHCEREIYSYDFCWKDDKNAGFGFPCNEKGEINFKDMTDCAKENYNKCISGEYDVINCGVNSYTHRWVEPAIGICECCGSKVYLSGFTNTCDNCDADYSLSGNLLAPRSQWGIETGETAEEILMADVDYRNSQLEL